MEIEPLDVTKLVETAVDVVRPEAGTKEISLDVVTAPGVSSLNGDGGRLQQVLGNVLSNAIKFTPRGGHVRVRVAQAESTLSLQITETGRGIAPEFLPYVFDRFKQADGSSDRSSAGLGLGLALVREMVHAHHGTIVAESPGRGKGSTFTINLPLSVSVPPAIETAPAWRADAATQSLPRLDVLIVDDDGDVRDILRLLLESRGASAG